MPKEEEGEEAEPLGRSQCGKEEFGLFPAGTREPQKASEQGVLWSKGGDCEARSIRRGWVRAHQVGCHRAPDQGCREEGTRR